MLGMGDKHRKGQCVDTLIGAGVVIRGDLRFSGGCYIEGTVHGKVIAEEGAKAVLTIAEHGLVEGEVHAPVVVISGRMNGDVHAGERIELLAPARVQGNVHYQVVEMAAGAKLSGRLIHADTPLSQLAEREPPARPAPVASLRAAE